LMAAVKLLCTIGIDCAQEQDLSIMENQGLL